MKRLLPILLLMVSVGVGAVDLKDVMKLMETKQCPKCDFSWALLMNDDLSGVNLREANLSGANLVGENLEDALHFYSVDTTGATFCRTIRSDGSTNNSGC
ncbi:MAG TPA: hypothetical protein EYM44_02995 [Gammaproteobacteria bacterium]|nr:hypothetical protein [Gammaproteobacteria bacterium]